MINATDRVTNRLIHEKSPYLLQHAHNPVNWYPWGEEAFEKAKSEDKPVFLSIGYSTCHWCHVMSEESFEDNEVADLLNSDFVSIKVDREERGDIDSIYMRVCQAYTGQGGWPLTIIMTPDQKPFFAGTYFPKHERYGMIGFVELLQAVKEQWHTNRDNLVQAGEEIIGELEDKGSDKPSTEISREIIRKAIESYKYQFDSKYGGFGGTPKFPTPHNLMLMLRYYHLENDSSALEIVEKTLIQMYKGGIFDHIGFGFSRYSTDKKWLVPHFEKMLYDNALLTIIYLETYQVTKVELYKDVAVKILEYIQREMTDDEGGFYSAQDADSEGVEGKYYVFTPDEIKTLLGDDDAKTFNEHFDITESGNFEGKSIPNLIENENFSQGNEKLDELRKAVFEYRKSRTKLHKDDKILTSWNALMITAFAKAYHILGDEKYIKLAENAVVFLEKNLMNNNKPYIRYRDGQKYGRGLLDDYAFCIWAYIELYECTFNAVYLEKAIELNKYLLENFYDYENGGFYIYGNDSEKLIFRPKELYDGAIPSGNSVEAYNLARLAKLTGFVDLEELAFKQFKYITQNILYYPTGYSFSLLALSIAVYPAKEIVCVAKSQEDVQKVREITSRYYIPNTTVLIKDEKNSTITKNYSMKNDDTTFYICEKNTCSEPFNGFEEFEKRIGVGLY